MTARRIGWVMTGLLLSLPAFAWQQVPTSGAMNEAQAVDKANKAFDKMDDDHDGRVTELEMDRAHADHPDLGGVSSSDELRAADSNGDGQLTPEEQQEAARQSVMRGNAGDRNGTTDAGARQTQDGDAGNDH